MLKNHITASGLSQAQWAEILGIGRGYLSDLCNGKSAPSLELAVRIEDATNGAVLARHWVRCADENGEAA